MDAPGITFCGGEPIRISQPSLNHLSGERYLVAP
jgi:hypothetical protein